MTTKIPFNMNCDSMVSYPFWVMFVVLLIFLFILPLFMFYHNWWSRYPRGEGDLIIDDEVIYIPSISKTYRNYYSLFYVLTGIMIVLEYYIVCLDDINIIICIVIGFVVLLFVYSFNDEDGPISYVHGFFAFGFFIYLFWLTYAVSPYFYDGYIWYWPYFFMGISFLIMLGHTIINSRRKEKYKAKHWPFYVCLSEYVFVLSFMINILLIP